MGPAAFRRPWHGSVQRYVRRHGATNTRYALGRSSVMAVMAPFSSFICVCEEACPLALCTACPKGNGQVFGLLGVLAFKCELIWSEPTEHGLGLLIDVMSLGNAAAAEAREDPRGARETGVAGSTVPMGLLQGSDEMHALLLQRQGLSGYRP